MKTKKILILLVVLTLTLSACSSAKKEEEAQATINAMYTSVAQTLVVLTEQATPVVPTNTPEPTVTPQPTATQGATRTPTRIVPTSIPCDGSAFAGDITIPDNTVMNPGQTFTKTWSIKNSGTCDWTTSYKLVPLSGPALGGVATNLKAPIASGRADNVSVAMVAPTTKGTYASYWIMQNAAGQNFGEQVYVSIVVGTSITSTPTGTITPTPDAAATANAMATLGGAATALSQTQTAAPTPTE